MIELNLNVNIYLTQKSIANCILRLWTDLFVLQLLGFGNDLLMLLFFDNHTNCFNREMNDELIYFYEK